MQSTTHRGILSDQKKYPNTTVLSKNLNFVNYGDSVENQEYHSGLSDRIIQTTQCKFMYTDENILIEEPCMWKNGDKFSSAISSISKARRKSSFDITKDSNDYYNFKDNFEDIQDENRTQDRVGRQIFCKNAKKGYSRECFLRGVNDTNSSIGLSQLNDCPQLLKLGIIYGKTHAQNKIVMEDLVCFFSQKKVFF